MKEYENIISWLRAENSKIVFHVHKLCTKKGVADMFSGTKMLKDDAYDDDDAHIIALGDNLVAYRVLNHVWVIPATVRTIFADDGQFRFYFDYPCEMKVEDLETY